MSDTLLAVRAVRILLLLLVASRAISAQPGPQQPLGHSVQRIVVKLLDAKTAKPMTNKMITVRWGAWDTSEITLDKQGMGTVEVPAGVREFTLQEGPRVGNEPYRIAYIDCNDPHGSSVQVSQVIEKGFVPKNACGGKTALARPGEVVFWGLDKPWWQPDMQ